MNRLTQMAAAVTALSLTVLVAGCTTTTAGTPGADREPVDKSDIVLVTSIITTANEYQLNSADGSQAFADSVGVDLEIVNSNGDSQQEISQIQALMTTGKTAVVLVNPVSSADVPAIIDAATTSNAFVATQFNKPDEYVVADHDAYVAHMGFDGVEAGEYIATQLFEAMGGEGNVIALQGVLDSSAGQQRFAGLQKALEKYPNITLLEDQAANWDQQQGYSVTQSLEAKYGDEIDGVWGASDSMTLGAMSALQAAGHDDVKYVGMDGDSPAISAIKDGDSYVATWASDPWYNGAIGLAIPYWVATGELVLSEMTPEQRDGTYRQTGVNKENVDEWTTPPTADEIMAEIEKGPFDRLVGPAVDLDN